MCGSTLDHHGDHLLSCGYGPLCICRHDALTYLLFQALLQDNSQDNESSVYLVPLIAIHLGDIFHPDFADGQPTYFDISVRNSLLPQFLNRVSFAAGVASSMMR